jgi:hypothetical protein
MITIKDGILMYELTKEDSENSKQIMRHYLKPILMACDLDMTSKRTLGELIAISNGVNNAMNEKAVYNSQRNILNIIGNGLRVRMCPMCTDYNARIRFGGLDQKSDVHCATCGYIMAEWM